MLTWEWLHSWWVHLRGSSTLRLIVVRSGDELIAIAPLRLVNGPLPFLSRLEFLGTGDAGSDYLDLIVREGREQEALPALADHLARGNTMLDLAQIRRASSLALDLAGRFEGRGWGLSESVTAVCPYIDLTGHTWESYLAGLGPSHRANTKRRLRNLTRSSELRFTEAGSDEE